VQREHLIDEDEGRMGRILAHRHFEWVAAVLQILDGADAGLGIDHHHEPVPARIAGNDAHRQLLLEDADAAIGLRQERRGIDEGELDLALRDALGDDGRAGGHAEPRREVIGAAAADGDAHVTVAAIGRQRIAGDVQADLPQCLGADEIGALRQRFHDASLF